MHPVPSRPAAAFLAAFLCASPLALADADGGARGATARLSAKARQAQRGHGGPRAMHAPALNAVVTAGSVGCLGVSDACRARDATLDTPEYIAFNPAGTMFFTNSHDNQNQLLRVEPVRPDPADPRTWSYADGTVTPFAQGIYPFGLAVDDRGDVFNFDAGKGRLVHYPADHPVTGAATVIAGLGDCLGPGCLAKDTQLGFVQCIVIDPADGTLTMSDSDLRRVRRIVPLPTPTGGRDYANALMIDVAGGGAPADGVGDGANPLAARMDPTCVDVDLETKDIYILDNLNHRIRRVAPGGGISTVLGGGGVCQPEGNPPRFTRACGDGGPGLSAFIGPHALSLALDQESKALYLADTQMHRIRKLLPGPDGRIDGGSGETVSTVVGTGDSGFNGDDRPPLETTLSFPFDVTVYRGILHIGDTHIHTMRMVDLSAAAPKVVRTAGTGVLDRTVGFAPATASTLVTPSSVACKGDGTCFVSDLITNIVYAVSSDGDIAYHAGRPGMGAGRFGPLDGNLATEAHLARPDRLAVDGNDLYLLDTGMARVRRIDADGVIHHVAGNGDYGIPTDGGVATEEPLGDLMGLCAHDGVVYVASIVFGEQGPEDHRLLRIDRQGTITHVAGGPGYGYTPDGAPALGAKLAWSSGCAVNPWTGELFFAEEDNSVVRKVTADGLLETVAGDHENGFDFGGDGGPALGARFFFPTGLAFHPDRSLLIVDALNAVVWSLTPQGASYRDGTIRVIAGTPQEPFSYGPDGGRATEARFGLPTSVAVDAAGNVFVTDIENDLLYRVGVAASWNAHEASARIDFVDFDVDSVDVCSITAQVIDPMTLVRSAKLRLSDHRAFRSGNGIVDLVAQLGAPLQALLPGGVEVLLRIEGRDLSGRFFTGDARVTSPH